MANVRNNPILTNSPSSTITFKHKKVGFGLKNIFVYVPHEDFHVHEIFNRPNEFIINHLRTPDKIQPNKETRKRQLDVWKSLVLEYHSSNKQYILDVREAEKCPLFNNTSINRKLSQEGILSVLEILQRSGNAEPLNKERSRWHIYWKTLAEWGALVYNWAQESGQINSVCTLYEIINTPDQKFSGIDQSVLLKSLRTLEMGKKAEVIANDGDYGVKFF